MQFHFPTGLEEPGEFFARVQSITVETYSYHPRTNRRKLRKFIQSAWGVKPQYVKLFLKEMGFWTPGQLGESADVRHKLYAEALKWQQQQLSQTN